VSGIKGKGRRRRGEKKFPGKIHSFKEEVGTGNLMRKLVCPTCTFSRGEETKISVTFMSVQQCSGGGEVSEHKEQRRGSRETRGKAWDYYYGNNNNTDYTGVSCFFN